jgi:signal transduction histidine kinase
MNQAEAPVPARAKRSGGSIVWKITARQSLRTLGIFFWINLLVAMLFWGGGWYGSEKIAARMVPAAPASGVGRGDVTGGFFSVTTREGTLEGGAGDEIEGLLIKRSWTNRLGLLPGARGLRVPDTSLPWWEEPQNYEWVIITPAGGKLLAEITFTPGVIWQGFTAVFGVLVFFEALCLVSGIFKISASVRNTLRPIGQLTQAARQTMAQPIRPAELQLGGAIDTLNAINENRLDTRIDVNSERAELRGLATAINSMLDRVDFAYRSQLRFVSDASHELRTPISVIQGYANLLDRWGKEDPKALEESIAAIKHEAEQMKELVEQLLFLARSDNNSIAMKPEWLDISELMAEVSKESGMIDRAHRISFPDRPPLYIMGDPQLLKQALRILVDNAIKYTPEDGRVTLDVKGLDGTAVLSVTDSGIGIGSGDLPRLFERFYRTDASRARQTGGSGLGLSIAKWIVDSHGGVIEILSREGLGTRMTIKIPVES